MNNDKIVAMVCVTIIALAAIIASLFQKLDPEAGEICRMIISGIFGAAVGITWRAKAGGPGFYSLTDYGLTDRQPARKPNGPPPAPKPQKAPGAP